MITEIMHIDNTFDDLSVTDRKKQRQLVLSEKVDAYFAWARQKYSQVTHNSTIGKALAYSINQEEYLRGWECPDGQQLCRTGNPAFYHWP